MADATTSKDTAPIAEPGKAVQRKIPGSLPYTTSAGTLRRVMEQIPTSEKPSIFNADFLGTVMATTGGSARPIVPILKSVGLLTQTGAPTELYAQYQTDTGRPTAALNALRNGYAEIFRRNQYAHKATEEALTDIIVAITGLPKKDSIVRSIRNTFQVFQDTAKVATDENSQPLKDREEVPPDFGVHLEDKPKVGANLQLAYNINVVLPETTNVEVYNAIFRSLKGNLLT